MQVLSLVNLTNVSLLPLLPDFLGDGADRGRGLVPAPTLRTDGISTRRYLDETGQWSQPFYGVSQRFMLMDASAGDLSRRFYFQSALPGGATTVGLIPGVGGTSSTLNLFGGFTDFGNYSVFQVRANNSGAHALISANLGTGTLLPITVAVGGTEVTRFDTGFNVGIGGPGGTATAFGANWRTLQIFSNTNVEGGVLRLSTSNGTTIVGDIFVSATTFAAMVIRTATNHVLRLQTNSVDAIAIGTGQDVYSGGLVAASDLTGSAPALNATLGFHHIIGFAGAPIGVPTGANANRVPVAADTTNTNLYFYSGAWKKVVPSPLTTKGDLWGFTTVDARVSVGINGQVLASDSTQGSGVKWTNSGSNASPVQSPWATKQVNLYFTNGSTAPGGIGDTITAVAAGILQAPTTANGVFGLTQRIRYTSNAAKTSLCGLRSSVPHWLRGDGTRPGGWYYSATSGISTFQTGHRWFWGFAARTTGQTNIEPSTEVDCIFFGCDSTDTNWQFMCNDSAGTCTKVSTGMSCNTAALTDWFRVEMTCSGSGANKIDCLVTRLNDGTTFSTSFTTNLPTATTLMTWHSEMNNGGIVAASGSVGFDFGQTYIENPS